MDINHYVHKGTDSLDPRVTQLLNMVGTIYKYIDDLAKTKTHPPTPTTPDTRLDQVIVLLQQQVAQGRSIMATLADLTASVQEEAAAVTQAIAAINAETAQIASLQAQLTTAIANQADPAAIQDIVDQIHATTAALTSVLPAASTPAAEPAPAPVEAAPDATAAPNA